MKNIYKFLPVIIFSILISFIGCQEETDYPDLIDLGTNPTFVTQVAVGSATDLSFDITITPDIIGVAYYVVTIAGSVEEKPTFEDVIDGAVDGTVASGSIEFETTDADAVTITGLDSYTSYDVFAVMTNNNGLSAQVSDKVTISTSDIVDPVIVDMVPFGQDPKVAANQPMIITFDEAVNYDNTKDVTIWSYWAGIDVIVPEDSISISGNTVTISYGVLPYNNYIFVEFEEGAFVDVAGNGAEALVSGVVGGYLVGFWFRTELDPATQLASVFDSFLGDIACTDYDYADSTTVDYGPYGVTITADEETEEPYDIIITGFWGYGVDARMTLHEDGTVSCVPNLIDGLTYGGEEIVWVRAYDGANPYAPGAPVGHWDGASLSFNISVEIYVEYLGYFARLYQVYDASKKAGLNTKPNDYPMELTPFE